MDTVIKVSLEEEQLKKLCDWIAAEQEVLDDLPFTSYYKGVLTRAANGRCLIFSSNNVDYKSFKSDCFTADTTVEVILLYCQDDIVELWNAEQLSRHVSIRQILTNSVIIKNTKLLEELQRQIDQHFIGDSNEDQILARISDFINRLPGMESPKKKLLTLNNLEFKGRSKEMEQLIQDIIHILSDRDKSIRRIINLIGK
jgi:hypothetical protein